MKKAIKVTLTILIIFAFTLQGIMAQGLLASSKKSAKLNNGQTIKTLVDLGAQLDDPVEATSQDLNVSTINIVNEKAATGIQGGLNMPNRLSDLMVTDEEQPMEIEKWMLNPCDWLCTD
jgi:hypothetical protein